MTLDIYSKDYKKVGTLEAPESVFDVRWNSNLVRQVLDASEANRRQPLAHTKGRGDVRGGGKRPYAQKHTGNSRQSSIRSPLWPGGGTTFGPSNERNFTKKVNRKVKRLAMLALLSKKLKGSEVFIVDNFSLSAPKTKLVAEMVKKFFGKPSSVLFVTSTASGSFVRAAKNLPKTTISPASSLNAYDCALRRFVIIEAAAVAEIARENVTPEMKASAKQAKVKPAKVKKEKVVKAKAPKVVKKTAKKASSK